jgi:hypothetical protein
MQVGGIVGAVKSIQRGTILIYVGITSATATIGAVNTAKSSLSLLGYSVSTGGSMSDNSPRLSLTDATTITAERFSTTNNTAVTVSWQLVEYN